MRAFKRTNRWDVQVVFPEMAFGVKSRSDVEQTPETVCDALEEFCRRVRKGLQRTPVSDAASPETLDVDQGERAK